MLPQRASSVFKVMCKQTREQHKISEAGSGSRFCILMLLSLLLAIDINIIILL